MLLQTAIPTLVRELGCLSVDLSVCPVPTAGKQKWWEGRRAVGQATSGRTHLSVNWTAFPCSMQIRSIDWNTDWAVSVLHTRFIPSLHSSSPFVGHTSFTTTETKGKVQSTDHELIPATNASLAAVQGSASGSNVRYDPTWIYSSLKEINEQGCYN
jgi:hypothetical protein